MFDGSLPPTAPVVNPEKPVFNANDFQVTALVLSNPADAGTLAPTKAPTSAPIHPGYAAVEVEITVTVVIAELKLMLSAAEAENPVMRKALEGGFASSKTDCFGGGCCLVVVVVVVCLCKRII